MYVSIEPEDDSTDIVISEYYNFARYGDVLVCNGRKFQFTDVNVPDVVKFGEYEKVIGGSCVTIDDNDNSQNRNPAMFGGLYPFTTSFDGFRGGDVITTLVGPLFYSFSKWRVQPMVEAELQYTSGTRPDPPTLPAGDIKLVFANLYNYWVTYGTDRDLRGADSEEEFIRQSAKTSLALSMLDADIIAVCELENLDGNLAAIDLRDKVNAKFPSGSRVYEAATIAAGIDKVGGDVIKTEVFYDTTKFNYLAASVLTDAEVDGEILNKTSTGLIFGGGAVEGGLSRSPIAVSLQTIASGGQITVVSSHYKSKGVYSGDPPGLDGDKNDGAGGWNWVRTLTTEAIAKWLKGYP